MIYFIKCCDNLIKIGFSVKPIERIKILQTGCPYEYTTELIVNGSRKCEKSLHKHFEKYKYNSEWFIYEDEIKKYIEECKKFDALVPFYNKTNIKLIKRENINEYINKRLVDEFSNELSELSFLFKDDSRKHIIQNIIECRKEKYIEDYCRIYSNSKDKYPFKETLSERQEVVEIYY